MKIYSLSQFTKPVNYSAFTANPVSYQSLNSNSQSKKSPDLHPAEVFSFLSASSIPAHLSSAKLDSCKKLAGNSSKIAFTAISDKHEIDKRKIDNDELVSNLALIGAVGVPLVLSIAANCYVLKGESPDKIFLPDGSFFMDTENMKAESDLLTVSPNDGIYKIEGTPINIDSSKYDFSDPVNGIFKNYDGTVDIDLLNNKYIDANNGIFIDPKNFVSCLKLPDGSIQELVLPQLDNPNFTGSPFSETFPVHRLTRSEYIAEHNATPEEDLKDFYSDSQLIPESALDRVVDPDDNRSFTKKLLDFFNPFVRDNGINNMYDKSKQYDIFGREIITVTNSDGNTYKIALDDFISKFSHDNHLSDESIGKLVEWADKTKINNYIINCLPQDTDVELIPVDSVQELSKNIKIGYELPEQISKAVESVDAVNAVSTADAWDVIINNTQEHHSTFSEFISNLMGFN